MAIPQSVTFDENTPEADRTINFGNRSASKANEYNISVIDAGGDSITGTVNGVVSLDAHSPFADRPETTANTVDLATGCRKFTLFIASINRAVYSVTGLTPGAKVVVTALRSAA